MQEEKLRQGSPQINGVFEYPSHEQSFDKKLCHKQLFAKKSIMLGRTEQNLKLKVFEHESNLAG